MAAGRADYTATLLLDGRVLLAGGSASIPDAVLASAELYDPRSGSWTAAPNMGEGHAGHTATLLLDGRVLVAGSGSGNGSLTAAELYDPRSGSWTGTAPMNEGRSGHTATLLPDGTVLVAGGCCDAGGSFVTSAELYDPGNGSWTATGNMIEVRAGQTATLLADGRVLVVGGGGEVTLAEGPAYGATAELYDPSDGRWRATGSMSMARFAHTATRLPNGNVLVVGGSIGDDATARSAELYDPSRGTWTLTSSMANARSGHTATRLADGTVLVAGGVGLGSTPSPLASAELYDPSSATWTLTESMAEACSGHTATLLLDGRVLVVGGYDSRASAELYDPRER